MYKLLKIEEYECLFCGKKYKSHKEAEKCFFDHTDDDIQLVGKCPSCGSGSPNVRLGAYNSYENGLTKCHDKWHDDSKLKLNEEGVFMNNNMFSKIKSIKVRCIYCGGTKKHPNIISGNPHTSLFAGELCLDRFHAKYYKNHDLIE